MQSISSALILGVNDRSKAVFSVIKDRHHSSVTMGLFDKGALSINGQSLDPADQFKKFDIVVLAGTSSIIPSRFLKLPKHGFITCHAGQLPDMRGSSPLSWAIIGKKKYFGLTVFKTDAEIDEGAIYVEKRYNLLKTYNIENLHNIASIEFPEMVLTAFLMIEANIQPVKQITQKMEKYYPLRTKNDALVDFKIMDASDVLRLYRAVFPRYHRPFFKGKNKFLEFDVISVEKKFLGTPGRIYRANKDQLLIACRNDAVWVRLEYEFDSQLKVYEMAANLNL